MSGRRRRVVTRAALGASEAWGADFPGGGERTAAASVGRRVVFVDGPPCGRADCPAPEPEKPAPAKKPPWRERMAAEVEALTGGDLPPVFGPLRDGKARWMPFTVGLRDAFLACYRDAFLACYREADPARVRRVFARLAGSDPYLRALAREGARRHDLDGTALGPVSEAHRARAARQLEARRAKEGGSP